MSVLISMVDTQRFPGDEIVDLYSQRWEIELGYREIKQGPIGGEYTLRSKTPEMIAQELWGVLPGPAKPVNVSQTALSAALTAAFDLRTALPVELSHFG